MSTRVWNEEKQEAELVSGFGKWSEVTGKPFESIDNDTLVNENGVLKASAKIEVDDTLSGTSTNPVQNKVITAEVNALNDKLANIYEDGFATRNQLNINNHLANAFINGSNGVITSSSGTDTYWMKCKRNTTYTVSRDKGNRTIIGGCSYEPKIGDTISIIYNKGTFENPVSFNSGNNDYIVFFGNSNADNKATWIQIEEGSDATAYTPYADSNVTLTKIVDDSHDWLKSRNLVDVPIILGTRSLTGILEASTESTSIKDIIKVSPNTDYTCSIITNLTKNPSSYRYYFYDANGLLIETENIGDVLTHSFTTPNNCYGYAFQSGSGSTALVGSKIQFEYGLTKTEYAEYSESNVELTKRLDTVYDGGFASANVEDFSKLGTSNSFVKNNNDGTYTVNGTTGSSGHAFNLLGYATDNNKVRDYKDFYLYIKVENPSARSVNLRVQSYNGTTVKTYDCQANLANPINCVHVTLGSDEYVKRLVIQLASSETYTNTKIFPMISLTPIDVNTVWSPYVKSNVKLTEELANVENVEKGSINFNSSVSIYNNYNVLAKNNKVVSIVAAITLDSETTSSINIATIPYKPITNYAFLDICSAQSPFASIGNAFIKDADGTLNIPKGIPEGSYFLTGTYITKN